MERVEGYFENPRRTNMSIRAFLLVLSGIALLIMALLLKSAVFLLLLFMFALAVMAIIGLSNKPGKTNAKLATKLILTKIGECFRLEQPENNGTKILFDNLKWRELIIVEYVIPRDNTRHAPYYGYYDLEPIIIRQLQLRIWNEKEQIVLIEKLDKQSVDGIKKFKMTELHKADFVSLEPGTLQKMNALMNVSESIWE